jgi:hypothetical protein
MEIISWRSINFRAFFAIPGRVADMSFLPPRSSSSDTFDIRVIFEIPLRQFAPWLASVLMVTWAGYPGVVCVTPVAWLIASRVGLFCAMRSKSVQSTRRLQEAALAGGWFGFLQGVLFWVIMPRLGEVKADEQTSALILSVAMLVVGMLVGAGFSTFTAYQFERRRAA